MRPLLDRAVDPGLRFRQARRGGARGRAGRRRLDPSRRDGRAFRAEHHFRAGRRAAMRPHTKKMFDVHLMIAPCDPYLEAFAKAGSDIITVHVESGPHVHRSLQAIRALGKKAGVTLNPGTPVETIENVIDLVDLILIMSVNPGFGGQAFIPAALEKVARLRALVGGAADRHRGRRRRHGGQCRRRSRAPAPTCWSRARPCSRAAPRRLRAQHRGDPQRRRAGARGSGVNAPRAARCALITLPDEMCHRRNDRSRDRDARAAARRAGGMRGSGRSRDDVNAAADPRPASDRVVSRRCFGVLRVRRADLLPRDDGNRARLSESGLMVRSHEGHLIRRQI